MKPRNASHTAGRITRPLRHNGEPYNGINILILWASAIEQGFTVPRWMTFAQALELKGHVRKGEKNIPLEADHHSAAIQSVAALLAECWPACQRNPGHPPTGTGVWLPAESSINLRSHLFEF